MCCGGAGMPAFAIIFGELANGIYDPDREKAADTVRPSLAFLFFIVQFGRN
jgi:hypothetical protein